MPILLDETQTRRYHSQVFSGRSPFYDMNRIAGNSLMLEGHRPGRPDHPKLSDRMWELIQNCWNVDPAQRKTITEIVADLEAELAGH